MDTTIVAVPVANGVLCAHFGHCQQFALFSVDRQLRQIQEVRLLEPPPHEPGVLPQWLRGERVEVVIAGGIGRRARDIFEDQGTELIIGASADDPHKVVQAYLDGDLTVASNPCDH